MMEEAAFCARNFQAEQGYIEISLDQSYLTPSCLAISQSRACSMQRRTRLKRLSSHYWRRFGFACSSAIEQNYIPF
jgi:hypothetical protein